MKPFKLFLAGLMLLMLPAAAGAQSNIYDKYSDKPQVMSVYISKTMLEMQPEVYNKDLNISKVAGKLESVYIVSSIDNTIKRSLSSDIAEFIRKGKYEVLMKQKGMVSSSSFYVKKKGDKVKELIMITDGPAKLNYIHLIGEMTLKDIQSITSSQQMSYHIYEPLQHVMAGDVLDIDLSSFEDYLRNLEFTVQQSLKNINIHGVSIGL